MAFRREERQGCTRPANSSVPVACNYSDRLRLDLRRFGLDVIASFGQHSQAVHLRQVFAADQEQQANLHFELVVVRSVLVSVFSAADEEVVVVGRQKKEKQS